MDNENEKQETKPLDIKHLSPKQIALFSVECILALFGIICALVYLSYPKKYSFHFLLSALAISPLGYVAIDRLEMERAEKSSVLLRVGIQMLISLILFIMAVIGAAYYGDATTEIEPTPIVAEVTEIETEAVMIEPETEEMILSEVETTAPEPSESPTSPEPTTEAETIPETTETPTETVTEPETEAQTEKAVETTSKMKVDNNFISNHDSQIIAVATLALENFIIDYDMSLAPQRWTIAPFDDNDTVMTTVDISYNGKSGKYIYVGTLEINQKTGRIDSAQPHFLYVIDTVLGDDGYCDDFFAKINALG